MEITSLYNSLRTDRSLNYLMGAIKSFMILFWCVYNIVAFDLVDAKAGRSDCVPSSCGHIHNISYPFRLQHDPQHCGESAYTLSCENNVTILNHIQSSGKFYVQAINYNNRTIRAVDASILNNNASSIPSYSLTDYMLEFINSDLYYVVRSSFMTNSPDCIPPQNNTAGGEGSTCKGTYIIYILKCANPVKSSLYVDTSPCFRSQPNSYGYVKVNTMVVGELEDGCSVEQMTFVYLSDDWDSTCKYIQKALLYGFEMNYFDPLEFFCGRQWSTNYKCFPKSFTGLFRFLWELIYDFFSSGDYASIDMRSTHIHDLRIAGVMGIGLLLTGRFIFLAPILIVPVLYKWQRRHLSMYNTIEEFLQGENNFVPIRYSYSDIKKMSNKFKDKLGEGGYGCVFKAKLRSGHYGAIKILDKPKANGQEFISEAGRYHWKDSSC